MKKLTEKLGLSKSTIYQKIKDGEFPAPFSIGNGRSRGWLESTVDSWIQEQLTRDGAQK
ncbi:AlpA family phage regulatory protein [Cupriavidus taiwanensis]|uniref:helix-turn-helix transcriptional regulator n=1 Tax=Cupriavidus taiwanensis TaxID=164546 RepID=UPI0018DC75C7|nr:AlpA family phage regulatory protein [Cupriavidus taiwanensis]